MPKFETQINQVYLVHPENKKTSLILHEEKLRDSLQLFILLELSGIKKKTETNELKKISEIILNAFRANQKMPLGNLFESALAGINQNLAGMAQKGAKSWLGKFSAIIGLRSETEIFLANTGLTSAWIKRKANFSEILGSEKKGEHPLKTFLNFASGKIKEGDSVILTTTSLFNFVSLELLTKLLAENDLEATCAQVSEILQESASSDDSFASFFLGFQRLTESPTAQVPIFAPLSRAANNDVRPKKEQKAKVEKPKYDGPTYAPLPEDLKAEAANSWQMPKAEKLKNLLSFAKPSLELKGLGLSRLPFRSFGRLSPSAKFFLISFLLLLCILVANLVIWGNRTDGKKLQEKTAATADAVVHSMAEAESALIYKNEDQAVKLLSQAKGELEQLKKLDEKKYNELFAKYNLLSDRINRITTVTSPKVIAQLRHNPVFMTKAGSSLVFSGKDSKSISTLGDEYKTLFLLNEVAGEINGFTHVPGTGNLLVTDKHIYRINGTLNQFDAIYDSNKAVLFGIKFLAPNRVYSADKAGNQIYRFQVSGSSLGKPTGVLKTGVNLANLQDFGMDTDIYLLFPNEIKKFVTGSEQSFRVNSLTEPMTDAKKMIIGSSIYVLEPSKRRLLVFSKRGEVLNQVYFPNSSELTDFYVNETERRVQLINGNSLLEITI